MDNFTNEHVHIQMYILADVTFLREGKQSRTKAKCSSQCLKAVEDRHQVFHVITVVKHLTTTYLQWRNTIAC